MAKAKTQPTKAEQKQIRITMAEHAKLIERIEDGIENTEEGDVFKFAVFTFDGESFHNTSLQDAIADALEHAASAEEGNGLEDEQAEDDSEGGGIKTIVPVKYRDEYKARGDARSNGDWFAHTFRLLCNGSNKKSPVNLDLVYAIARANGVDKTWPHLNNGQQRMNAGNMVRRVVEASGVLVVPAGINGPEEQRMSAAEWVAEVKAVKAAKAAAKAQA